MAMVVSGAVGPEGTTGSQHRGAFREPAAEQGRGRGLPHGQLPCVMQSPL